MAGAVHISAATYGRLAAQAAAAFVPTGGVAVKGKGQMDTYLYDLGAAA